MRFLLICLLVMAYVVSPVGAESFFSIIKRSIFGSEDHSNDSNGISEGLPHHTLNGNELEELVQKSMGLISEGKLEKSIPDLLSVLEQDPHDVGANTLLGTLFLELDRPDQAEHFLYKAVKGTEWSNVLPIVNLMSALRQNGDLELATEVGQSALNAGKLDTKNQALVGEVLGNTFMDMHKYGSASDWLFFACMADLEGASVKTWLQASTLVFPVTDRNPAVALSVLLEAAKVHPNDPRIVFYLGLATDLSGNVEEGITLYKSAIDLDREVGETENNGADAAAAAAPYVTQIPYVWASLGAAMQSTNRLDEADDCYTRAYAADPENGPMLVNWAFNSAQRGDGPKCAQAANEAVRVLGAESADAQRAQQSCNTAK
jgi:tetratricopeptide (TPR) repeat protein